MIRVIECCRGALGGLGGYFEGKWGFQVTEGNVSYVGV